MGSRRRSRSPIASSPRLDPAWTGRQSALGWQSFGANLSAIGGQTVRVRFAFQSDSSGTSPGVYIDDLSVSY